MVVDVLFHTFLEHHSNYQSPTRDTYINTNKEKHWCNNQPTVRLQYLHSFVIVHYPLLMISTVGEAVIVLTVIANLKSVNVENLVKYIVANSFFLLYNNIYLERNLFQISHDNKFHCQ